MRWPCEELGEEATGHGAWCRRECAAGRARALFIGGSSPPESPGWASGAQASGSVQVLYGEGSQSTEARRRPQQTAVRMPQRAGGQPLRGANAGVRSPWSQGSASDFATVWKTVPGQETLNHQSLCGFTSWETRKGTRHTCFSYNTARHKCMQTRAGGFWRRPAGRTGGSAWVCTWRLARVHASACVECVCARACSGVQVGKRGLTVKGEVEYCN